MTIDKEQLSYEDADIKSGKGIFLRTNQLVFMIIVVAAVVICVAVLCVYVPVRKCDNDADSQCTAHSHIDWAAPDNGWAIGPLAGPPSNRRPAPLIQHLPQTVHRWWRRLREPIKTDSRSTAGSPSGWHARRPRVASPFTSSTSTSTPWVVKKDGEVIESSYEFEDEYQFIHIDVETVLEEGEMYDIEVDYIGQLNEGLAGFYRSSYTNAAGDTVYVSCRNKVHTSESIFIILFF